MNALLSYLPGKLSKKPDSELSGNQLYANYLPRVLKEMGYSVDYIDWQDTSFKPDKIYDLFIGHGGYNFTKYAPYSNKAVYFSTGFYWREFNRLETERFDNLHWRRGVRLQPDRKITTDEESALQMADGIITLGNEVTRESYKDFSNVYPIGGMTAQVGQDLSKRDYDKGRKHFLFYSGNGAIHKGLDLLIEAFADTDLVLHVCISQPDTISMQNIYHPVGKNIHYYGRIDIHGNRFIELINLCDWIVSATCCEGCPSAVLECMAHGLVPIVTENASIDSFHGFYYDDGKWLNNISILDKEIIGDMSHKTQKQAQTYYSPAAFSLRLKEAVKAICQQ